MSDWKKIVDRLRAEARRRETVTVIEGNTAEPRPGLVSVEFSADILTDGMDHEATDAGKREVLRRTWRVLTTTFGGTDACPMID